MDTDRIPTTYRDNYARDLTAAARAARWTVDSWMGAQSAAEIRAAADAKAAGKRKATVRAEGRRLAFEDLALLIEATPDSLRERAAALKAEGDQTAEDAGGLTYGAYRLHCRAEAVTEIADRLEAEIATRHAEVEAEWEQTATDYGWTTREDI